MLRVIVGVIVLVLILSFFGVSIPGIVDSPIGQENFGYLRDLAIAGWQWLIDLGNTLIGFITGLWS